MSGLVGRRRVEGGRGGLSSSFKSSLYSKIKRGELIYAKETMGNGVFLSSETFQSERDRSKLSESYIRAFGEEERASSKPEYSKYDDDDDDDHDQLTKSALSSALRGLYGEEEERRKKENRPAVKNHRKFQEDENISATTTCTTPREYVSESPAPPRKSRKTPFPTKSSSMNKLKLLKTKMLRKTKSATASRFVKRESSPTSHQRQSQSSSFRPKSRPPPPRSAPPLTSNTQRSRYRTQQQPSESHREIVQKRRTRSSSSSLKSTTTPTITTTIECTRRTGCKCTMCSGGGSVMVASPQQLDLKKCPHCERKFNPDSFQKHVKACVNVFKKQRKRFDMASKRVRAVATENRVSNPNELVRNVRKNKKKIMVKKRGGRGIRKQSKWVAQSNQLREAMRSARSYKTKKKKNGKGGSSYSSYTPSAPDPTFQACPYCSRTFNPTAFERHVKHCKNAKSKPKRLRKGGGVSAGSRQARMSGSTSSSSRRRGSRW